MHRDGQSLRYHEFVRTILAAKRGLTVLKHSEGVDDECPLDRLLKQLCMLLPLEGVLIAATDTLMTNFELTENDVCLPAIDERASNLTSNDVVSTRCELDNRRCHLCSLGLCY